MQKEILHISSHSICLLRNNYNIVLDFPDMKESELTSVYYITSYYDVIRTATVL
jgi:hypothetical protein